MSDRVLLCPAVSGYVMPCPTVSVCVGKCPKVPVLPVILYGSVRVANRGVGDTPRA